MRSKILLAALAATAAFASPAGAQITTATEQAEARGTVLLPLTLTRDQDLDFGTVLASPTAGWVAVDADDGSRTADGVGVTLVALNPGQRGQFTGFGTVGQTVLLTLTPPVGSVLVGPGGVTIDVSSFDLDTVGGLTDTRIIGPGGTFVVGVGGTFDIAANQANGLYAANFDLTAEYQ